MYSSMPELLGEALCLNWTQNVVIMEAELTAEEHCWYIRQATARNLSKSELLRMIEDFAHLESVLDEKVDVWYNDDNDEISERTQYEENSVYLPWHSSFMIMHTFVDRGNIGQNKAESIENTTVSTTKAHGGKSG